MQRPWHGNGPLSKDDIACDMPWEIVAPSALSVGDGWQLPEALTEERICELIDDYISAAAFYKRWI